MSNRSSIDEICIVCSESLRIQIDSDSDGEDMEGSTSEPNYIYDDVELPCHHHLHYDCAREMHDQARIAITTCPLCDHSLLTNGQFLVIIRNEGGVTRDFDLGQDLDEQRQLQGDPELAKNEAFLSFCFSGDHEALQTLLADGANVNAIQRGTGMTGLHLCALNNDASGIKLLLNAAAIRDIRGLDNSTPLDLAISEGSHEAAYALQS